MVSQDDIERLRELISQSLAAQLQDATIDWSALQHLDKPVLRIEARLQNGTTSRTNAFSRGVIVSHVVDLSGIATPTVVSSPDAHLEPGRDQSSVTNEPESSGEVLPLVRSLTQLTTPYGDLVRYSDPQLLYSDETSPAIRQRKEISGFDSGDKFPSAASRSRPVTSSSPRRWTSWSAASGSRSTAASPSTRRVCWDQLQLKALACDDQSTRTAITPMANMESAATGILDRSTGGSFNQSTIFCRQVTQASRACRSLEVIVQARWIEHFDTYVDSCSTLDPTVSRTRCNKTALIEACADFGWTEKELRNKMCVWRGYKDIKDAGGWAALVFAGMGVYRFCKYRIGFDRESMLRLRNTRQLLAVVGEDTERVYEGHPHDYVVYLDGSKPVELRTTYLQWDPGFSYRHIDESIIDEWGSDDPRWTPPSDSLVGLSAMPVCEACGKDQSDNAKLNNCFCFPTLLGSARLAPSPVLVFRTSDGKNNGLMALCSFERGAPVGEFVGVITKGLQDVDVMESSTSSATYQIWQGRQGNFTRFVNHSCKANAQYQRFTWLDTQRIILVSKGIEAGSEITVDYSDKYWKGLDKKCLCGESCCRYRRDEEVRK